MGFLDKLLNQVKKEVTDAGKKQLNKAINNRTEKFTFASVPQSLEELKALPEAKLDTPFKTAALTMLVLLNYEKNPELCFAMLDELRGPDKMVPSMKAFINDRMQGKLYIVRSFFEGATVENNYVPTMPYTIKIMQNPYSYPEPNWATLFVKSAGADSERIIKFRHKPSTNQWFLNDIQCLADIRLPNAENPWA